MISRKGNILVLVLAGLALIFAVGMGYFFWQNQQLKPQPQSFATPNPITTSQPTQNPIPTVPAADETANWKTYTNTKYNYSVKYPPYVVYKESLFDGAIVNQKEEETTFSINGGALIISGNKGGLGLEGFGTIDVVVGGISSYKVYTSSTSGIITAITSPKKDDIYFDFTLPKDASKRKDVDDTITKILSTFKFTEANGNNSTSNTVNQGNVKITITPNSGPIGTKVMVTIIGVTPNPNAPFASLGFEDDQGPGEDSTINHGIDTRSFVSSQPYVTSYYIPQNVLIAAFPNAQNPSKKVPTHLGADFITLSYQDYDAFKAGIPSDQHIKIPFTVTAQ